MKLKLVALLFSQAASALTIDKSNYKQHLCDDRIFIPVSSVPVIDYVTPPYVAEALENIVRDDYRDYCHKRFYYEESVENERTATWRTHKPCGGNAKDMIAPSACMEKTGILYAQSCEKLKQDRDSMSNSWNSVMPKLVSCNNM